jgi:hypothetical protein
VGAEDENGAMGNFFDGFDENGTTAAELLDDIGIVDDFVVNVDGIAVGFEGQFDDVHGADHAGAKAAGADAQEYFSVGLCRHLLPKSMIYQNSIIPYGRHLRHRNSRRCDGFGGPSRLLLARDLL